jgi:two-component system sensor histidine kinase HydH
MGAILGVLLIFIDAGVAHAFGYRIDTTSWVEPALAAVVVVTYGFFGWTIGVLLLARAELKQSRAQVARAERLAALGALSAGIAHEVRNPLGVIKSAASLVREDAEVGSDTEKSARFIEEEVERLNGFVTGLLAFSRDAEPVRELVDLRALFSDAADLCQREVDAKEIKLVVEGASENQPRALTLGDAALLFRVLYGLLLNACQNSPARGKIKARVFEKDEAIQVRIADEGPGIAPENRSRVFDPFFTTRKGGTGLGLAVARQIVNKHGGQILVEDTARGASFLLQLPRAEAA